MSKLMTLAASALLVACASTSSIMPAGDNLYTLTAYAAPARGGTVGANEIAYQKANTFCKAQGGYAQIISETERDVYQSAELAYAARDSNDGGQRYHRSGAGASTMASGIARLFFTCTEGLTGE